MGQSDLTRPELTAFIATIQLGTELAVVAYFAKDIMKIALAWFGWVAKPKSKMTPDAKLGWLIIIGTIPVVALGLALRGFIENEVRSLWVIAFTLIGFGLILGISDIVGKKLKTLDSLSYKHGVIFGLGQALALIPGVSRSGGTISVGLLLGYTRQAAARYSFLLAIPAVMASGLFLFVSTVDDLSQEMLLATIISTSISAVVGLAVIHYLLKYLENGSFLPFVVWRVAVGAWLLWMLTNGTIVG
jgi:undecaprenyl-diphosphatase